jgi:hypothetical protein
MGLVSHDFDDDPQLHAFGIPTTKELSCKKRKSKGVLPTTAKVCTSTSDASARTQ